MNMSELHRDPVEELAEEFAARLRRGERPSLTEYTDRYPELADEIRQLFPALVVMEKFGSVAGPLTGPREPKPADSASNHLGDFRILREVGRGGMGIVYEAIQESLGRHVALKVLAGPRASGTYLERFHREAKAAARLHHTNIVPVFGVGEADGVHFYAMQFIRGHGLDVVLNEVRRLRNRQETTGDETDNAAAGVARSAAGALRPGSLTDIWKPNCTTGSAATGTERPALDISEVSLASQTESRYYREAARLCMQAADALQYAHGQGVLHRDIKPSNLLLDAQGTLWITDFGLAKAADANDLTESGDIVGTIRYMAPERFRGEADARSDVYALGMTLYELLTLRPAYNDSDRLRLVDRVATESPVSPRSVDPHIPQDLETIVLKAAAREPIDRYATAGALAEDLRRFLVDRPILARRHSQTEQLWRWCRRNPAIASLVASVFVLLTALAVVASVGAIRLSGALRESVAANADANAKLWDSLVSQARASRMTRQPGQRFDALRAVQKALDLPLPKVRSLDELRTEAIAALLLPDLQVAKEWNGSPAGTDAWAIDPAFQRYAQTDNQGNVSIRRIDDDTLLLYLRGSGGPVEPYYGLVFSPDGRYLHHRCRTRSGWSARLWKLDGAEPVVTVEGYCAIDFRGDSRQAAISYDDDAVRILDLPSGDEVARWSSGLPRCLVRWNPKQPQLALRGDKLLRIVVVETGKVLLENRLVDGLNNNISWHPDGRTVAFSDGSRKISLLDARTGKLVLQPLEGHRNSGIVFNFNSAGDRLISNDWSGILRLWDTRTGRQLLATPARGAVARFSAADSFLAADVSPSKTRLFRCRRGQEFCTIVPRNDPNQLYYLQALASMHKDGRLMAVVASRDHEIALVDIARGEEVARFPLHGLPMRFEPDGSAAWIAGSFGILRWPIHRDPANPAHYELGPPIRLPLPPGAGIVCSASDDGNRVGLTSSSRGALLWQRENNRTLELGPQSDVRNIAVSPDGRWIATGSHSLPEGAGAKVWDAASGQHVVDLPVGGLCQVGFSPDGKWLATTGGGPRLWEVDNWKEGPALGGSIYNPTFAFTADSKLLALGDAPGVVRLVVPSTGKEVARLSAPEPSRLMPCCFTPDSGRLVTLGGESGAIHVFDLREVREQLAELGLDWEAPPLPAASREPLEPIHVKISLGNFSAKALADNLVGDSNQLIRDQKYAEALAALREAVKTDATHAMAHNNLAWQLLAGPKELRDAKESLPLARKAVDLDASVLYLNSLGVALYRNGEFVEAVAILEKSLASGKGSSDAFDLFFLAMCHHHLGDARKAKDCFDRAVQWQLEKRGTLPANWVEELTEFQAEAKVLLER